MQKLLDTVPHGRIIKKLEENGINGKILKWLENTRMENESGS